MHAKIVVALLLLAATPVPAAAGDPPHLEIAAEVEAPAAFAAEHGKAATADASPVAPGSFELELGYAPVWNEAGVTAGAGPAQAAYTHALTLAATYGLAKDVDVKVSSVLATTHAGGYPNPDGPAPKDGSGMGDVRVGGRWRFLDVPGRALELAVLVEAVVPVGTRPTATQLGLSQGFWSGRIALVGTKDLGRATFSGELACMAPLGGEAQGLRAVAQANLAAGYHLLTWLQPELELNHQASIGAGSQVLAATAGVIAPWGAGNRVVAAVQRSLWGRNALQATGVVLAFKTAI